MRSTFKSRIADRDGQTLGTLAHGRENNFDFLRLLMAEIVIVSHSYPILLRSNASEPLHAATGGQRTMGEMAVEGFFLMSGFLICASWERGSGLLDYLKKRVLRIYPGFLVAVFFTALIAGPLRAEDRSAYWNAFDVRDFVVGALNLNNRMPRPDLNGSLWSIRYEFCCYLAVAGMGLLGFYRRRWLLIAASLGCTALYAAQLHFNLKMPGSGLSWLWCYPGEWPRLGACYLAGVAFYLYRDRIICSGKLAIAALLTLILAGCFPAAKMLPLLTPACAGYLFFYLAFVPDIGVQHIARRGDFSYGLYLYAMPIQHLIVHWYRPYLTPAVLTLTASVLALGAAYLSWTFVEGPCMVKKKPRTIEGERTPMTATISVEGNSAVS